MAFVPEPTRTPMEIGDIRVSLVDAVARDGTTRMEPAYQAAYFDVRIILSDGTAISRSGDLVPHITPAQRSALMDFMAGLRVQAEEQILGP